MPRGFAESSSQYLASIDAEIARLQSLRGQVVAVVDADEAIAKGSKPVRKGMSEEGRRRVAEAQKARWAKQKKASKAAAKGQAKRAATTKSASKKSAAKKASAVRTAELA